MRDNDFRISKDQAMTPELLAELITKHKQQVAVRFKPLIDAYKNDYRIMHAPRKPDFKPDNRIPVNFAKYIVDTLNGFFAGIPIKVTHEDAAVSEVLTDFGRYNDIDDANAELSKISSIFGRSYELLYIDSLGQPCVRYLSPMNAFMVYDDSILAEPLYFVHYYMDSNNVERGSYSDAKVVRWFVNNGSIKISDEEKVHGFDGVPAVEYVDNEEKMGAFESVFEMVNAYNKAVSEKANDVDYFADAYLKILGAELENETLNNLRSNRIINLKDDDNQNIVVDFLQKPNADTTQENLINRLERLIFQISMVPNINDENFGTASGIALRYKLQSMSNLAKTKERKFTAGFNRRYRLLFSNPLISGQGTSVKADDWVDIRYKFTLNIPANLLEEAQIAGALSGITSQETQLSVLSIVDDVKQEIERIGKDADALGYNTDYPTNRIGDELDAVTPKIEEVAEVQGKQLNGAQTQSLIAIMAQFTAGSLTEGQAINLIATAIGISKTEARAILNGDVQ